MSINKRISTPMHAQHRFDPFLYWTIFLTSPILFHGITAHKQFQQAFCIHWLEILFKIFTFSKNLFCGSHNKMAQIYIIISFSLCFGEIGMFGFHCLALYTSAWQFVSIVWETSKFLIWFSVLTVGSLFKLEHHCLSLDLRIITIPSHWKSFSYHFVRIAIKFSRFGALLPSFIIFIKYQSI